MAQFLIPAAMALPSLISGIMDIVGSARRANGGRMRRPRHRGRGLPNMEIHNPIAVGGRVKRRAPRKAHGRGIAADIIGGIPLIGNLLGPIVRSFGGGLPYAGVYNPIAYGGLLSPTGRGLPYMAIHNPISYGGKVHRRTRRGGLLSPTGRGLLGPGKYRPALYGGPSQPVILAPPPQVLARPSITTTAMPATQTVALPKVLPISTVPKVLPISTAPYSQPFSANPNPINNIPIMTGWSAPTIANVTAGSGYYGGLVRAQRARKHYKMRKAGGGKVKKAPKRK